MFFEDYKMPKDQKIGITHLLSNITTREGSHKGGWTRLLKCQLVNLGYTNVKILDNKDSILDYETIIFDLGAEFSGVLNLFGGLDEKVFKRLTEIKNFTGNLYSWRNELPSIISLSGRRFNASSCEAFKQTPETFLQEVQEVLNRTKVFQHAYKTSKILIGDSHTPSVWDPSYMIERRDGRTLKGMVERNTVSKCVLKFKDLGIPLNHITVHCSSIDIRHHACREEYPQSYILDLSQSLISELSALQSAYGVSFNIVETIGIEDESRELPKTGYFKGTPFSGSWSERNTLRITFNGLVKLWTNNTHIKYPDYFFDESCKLRFEVMERPQSIHISPEHYRWDLDNNRDRWIREEGR